MKHIGRIAAVLASSLTLWLFIGVEAVDYEHSTEYSVFLKQHPSLTVVYRNPVMCGECDLRRPENIGPDANKQFSAFCRARFDLDPGLCYAVYATQQMRADERAGRQSMRQRFSGPPQVRKWAPGFPFDTPEEVLDFAQARNLCDYFRGERPDAGQSERAGEVELGIRTYCTGTDTELARLRAKYAGEPQITAKLGEYEASVEAAARR